jgi:hypothetical protein
MSKAGTTPSDSIALPEPTESEHTDVVPGTARHAVRRIVVKCNRVWADNELRVKEIQQYGATTAATITNDGDGHPAVSYAKIESGLRGMPFEAADLLSYCTGNVRVEFREE